MNRFFISIITPCYNQAEYLDEALQSVVRQTYQYWECIIVNDGSTDNTEQVARKWIEKDKRFNYIYQENRGLSSARNAGLNFANGDFIQFLDADDILSKNKFLIQLKDLENCEISVCDYFPFEDKTGLRRENRYLSPFLNPDSYKKEVITKWETQKSIPCHAILFKKSIIDKHKIVFNECLPNHEDWVFWVKLFYHSKSLKNSYKILAKYRIKEVSMCTNEEQMHHGFVKASEILITYFQVLEDKKFGDYCKDKNSLIKNRKVNSALLKMLESWRKKFQ